MFESLNKLIDSTIKDEDIKNETKEIIKKINEEVSKTINVTRAKILNLNNETKDFEEE